MKRLNYDNKKLDNLADNIYYDIVIPYNPSSGGISLAQFQQQLTQPILYNPQDYYCAVVRFQVPGSNLPILIPEIQPFPNTDLNKTIYSVTLSYGTNISPQTFIEFISQSPNAPQSLPLTSTHPTADPTSYYYIFEYTWFLSLINTALASAFAAIPGGPPVNSLPPYFIFDPITERVSLIAQQAFYDRSTVATPINVYINYPLSAFLEGIRSIALSSASATGQDLLFDITNLNNSNWYTPSGPLVPPISPLTLLEMEQEYPTIANWNSLQTIQLVSNLLPINREYIPQYNSASQGIVSSQGILADFVPIVSLGPEARTSIEFISNGPWRLIDMFGSTPITRIDLTFYWTDQFGRQFIIIIPINHAVTCKLLFIKKSVYRNMKFK